MDGSVDTEQLPLSGQAPVLLTVSAKMTARKYWIPNEYSIFISSDLSGRRRKGGLWTTALGEYIPRTHELDKMTSHRFSVLRQLQIKDELSRIISWSIPELKQEARVNPIAL